MEIRISKRSLREALTVLGRVVLNKSSLPILECVRFEAFIPNDQSYFCGGCEFKAACGSWHRERSKSIFAPAVLPLSEAA